MKNEVTNFMNKTNKLYWIACFYAAFSYGIYFPFMMNIKLISQTIYGLDSESSSFMYSVPFMLAAVLIPLTGFVCDKFGYRTPLLLMGILCLSTALTLVWN